MSNHDAFIRTIVERPEDDGPRLVYADWLDEQGDCDRAEFIRVQIEMERYADDSPEQLSLQQRALELIERHPGEWEPPLCSQLLDQEPVPYWFRRGFVELNVSASTLLELADQLHDLCPIPSITITGYDTTSSPMPGLGSPTLWARLAKTPALARVQTMRCEFSDHGLIVLAESPLIRGLRHLSVEPAGSGITARGIMALAVSPYLNGLKRLDLDRLALTDDAAEVLASSRQLTGLADLDLTGNLIADDGALALSRTTLPSLNALNLEANQITIRGASALVGLRQLHWLNLARNIISSDVAQKLKQTFEHGDGEERSLIIGPVR